MSSPQEKANEIFIKCLESDILMDEISAKKCALIAVEEVWRQLEAARVFEDYDYWQEVKKEIEKL